jgi:chromosome segregation ATPase
MREDARISSVGSHQDRAKDYNAKMAKWYDDQCETLEKQLQEIVSKTHALKKTDYSAEIKKHQSFIEALQTKKDEEANLRKELRAQALKNAQASQTQMQKFYEDTGFNTSDQIIDYIQVVNTFSKSSYSYTNTLSSALGFVKSIISHSDSLEEILTGKRKLSSQIKSETLVEQMKTIYSTYHADKTHEFIWNVLVGLNPVIDRPVYVLFNEIFSDLERDLSKISFATDLEKLSDEYCDPYFDPNHVDSKAATKEIEASIKGLNREIASKARELRSSPEDKAIQDDLAKLKSQLANEEQKLVLAQGDTPKEIEKRTKKIKEFEASKDQLEDKLMELEQSDTATNEEIMAVEDQIKAVQKKITGEKNAIQNLEEDPKTKHKLKTDKQYFIRICTKLLKMISNALRTISTAESKNLTIDFVKMVYDSTVNHIGPLIDQYKGYVDDMRRQLQSTKSDSRARIAS